MPRTTYVKCSTEGCTNCRMTALLCASCRKRERYATDPAFRERELAKAKRWQSTERGREVNRAAARKYTDKKQGWGDGLYGRCIYLQASRCGICRRPFETGMQQNRDHDHTTGKARGILCNSCNLCLGHYERQQRPVGLVIDCYDQYLAAPPVSRLET